MSDRFRTGDEASGSAADPASASPVPAKAAANAAPAAPVAPAAPPPPATIDSTFRNGSLTVIGVVVGFSLGFLSRWATAPGEWTGDDLIAVATITLGIALQIKALADLLSRASLNVKLYDRSVRLFLIGLILVASGVVVAIFAEIIGRGGSALRGHF